MKLTVSKKITFFVLLITLIGLASFAYLAYIDADRLLRKHALSSLNNDLTVVSNDFHNSLDVLKKNLLFLQKSGPVLRLINANNKKNKKEAEVWRERVEKLLGLILDQNPAYMNLYLASAGEELPIVIVKRNEVTRSLSASCAIALDPFSISTLSQLPQNKIFISEICLTRHNELSNQLHPEWQVNIPLYQEDKYVGTVGITANLITDIISLRHSHENFAHFLTDENGKYLVHDNLMTVDSSTLKNIHTEYPTERFFSQSKKEGKNLSLDLPQLGVGLVINKLFFDPLNSERFITFGAIQLYASLSQDSKTYRNRLYLIMILVIVALGILTTIVASILVRPIKALTSISDQIASGDDNVEIPPTIGNDEISQLAQSMKIMLERLMFSKNELQQLAQTLEAKVMERTDELLEKNKEYAQIFNTAADGLVVIGKDFDILRVNNTFINLFDFTEKKVIGKKCYEILHGPLCHTSQCPLEKIKFGEERIEREEVKYGQDNIELSCIVTATLYRSVDGQLLGIVENFKDITDRKKIEQERENLIRKLQKALEEIKTLSGIIPICSSCKKIRDDKGYWNQVEAYVEKHSTAQFSHAICEECCEKLYAGENWYEEGKKNGDTPW